jgi:nitrile hydratase subunit beta
MDGIANTGGTPGWGRVPSPKADEPVFAEPWHGRAFALALLSSRAAGANMDAFRHSLERLDRAHYLDEGYFGR